MTSDIEDLRAEVAYRRAIPPWCNLLKEASTVKTVMLAVGFCPDLDSGEVQRRGRYCCLRCQYHNREAGKHPAERMG